MEEIYSTLEDVRVSVGVRKGIIRRTSCFFASPLCEKCERALWSLINSHESGGITFEHYSCMTEDCDHATALNLEIEYQPTKSRQNQ